MSSDHYSRRAFLKAAAATGLAAPFIAVACDDGEEVTSNPPPPDAEIITNPPPADAGIEDPLQIPVDGDLYPRAALAGSMEGDSALIRGYRAPEAEGECALRLWPANDPGAVITAPVTPEDGHLNLEVTGLLPGEAYVFAFFEADGAARSPEGRFRAAPAPGASPALTIGATACTNLRFAPWGGVPITAEAAPDVFCHLGDMVYNDGAMSLADFRAGWHTTLQTEDYRALFAQTGGYFTWDDHELTNNTEIDDLPPEARAAGVQAFFEALPIRRRAEGSDQFWTSHRWGDTAEIFILDCRSERIPEGPEARYISPEQMDWLKGALAASPCAFKVILNSVPIIGFPERFPAASDRWQGFPAQRDELLDFITGEDGGEGISGVWFLSGDLHMGCVAKLEVEGPRAEIREILVGPGGSYGNPLPWLIERDPEQAALFFPPAQFDFASARNAATLIHFDPEANTVRVEFKSAETGETVYDATYEG